MSNSRTPNGVVHLILLLPGWRTSTTRMRHVWHLISCTSFRAAQPIQAPSPPPSRASVRRSSGEYCPGGCSDVAQMRVRVWVRVRMSAGVTGRAALVLVHIVVFGVVRLEDHGVLSRPDPSCYPTLSIFLPLLGLVPRARCAAKRNSIPISSPRAIFSTNQSAAVVVEAIAKLGPGEPRWVYDAHTGCRMYSLEVTEFIFHFLFSRIRRNEPLQVTSSA